jgi:acyl-CoA synthetase (AMP-forming)/AMP-acid ligase II
VPTSSPYPDVDVPDVALTPFVLERAAELGDKPALVDGETGRTITFGELRTRVRSLAAGLAARGLLRGDVVALFCPNVIEYALVLHAVAVAGGASATLSPQASEDELARYLMIARARFLVTSQELLATARGAARRAGVDDVFTVDEGSESPLRSLETEAGRARGATFDPATTIAALPFSSGTTGWPKPVMLAHRGLVANLCQVDAVHHLGPPDVVIGVLPFFHIYGLTVVMNLALRKGATVVTMRRFELGSFLDIVERYGVTVAHLVPPIILALAKRPEVDGRDLSRLRAVMSGAAPLSPEVAAACTDRIGCPITQGYGLTEASPVTHLTPDEGPIVAGSIGPCLPSTSCKVVDARGEEVAPGQRGELLISGPQLMRGYLDDEQATGAVLDHDGWLHSGDLGHVDDNGYFFIADRLKEIINYKGHQVAPAELEAALVAHPGIADAAVVGVPDPEAGEIPIAYVVPAGPVDPGDLLAFVAARVAPYKKVRRIEIVDVIPRSPSGKILRRRLREAGRRERPC